MAQIPQRELRNNVSEVLRRAERGERLTVTVDGRPVAELGPIARDRRAADAPSLDRVFAAGPVDRAWSDDLDRMRDKDHEAAGER